MSNLEKMGVEIQLNMVIGKVLTIPELFDMGYESVFIGSGAGLPMFMKIPGESLVGVYSANEYLTRINLMKPISGQRDSHPPQPQGGGGGRRQRGHGRRPLRQAPGGRGPHRLPPL